ncbi:MAG: MmgE/PrpD family protein [Pseudomonadota bacterium]
MPPLEDRPGDVTAAGIEAPLLTQALCQFAALPAEAMPPLARATARLSLLDWAAVALAGAEEPVSKIVRQAALRDGGRAEAGIIGSPVRLPARAAALVNGTVSHALDYDDTHFLHVGHPSVAILPAVLALAEAEGLPGRAVLPAALVGMEASCRVGHWLGTAHYNAGFHQTATAGGFGATIAAARLLGLPPEAVAMALGLASTRVSGLKSQFGTMGKPFNAGLAASNGVEAARLAAAGFLSAPGALEGPQGFGETHAQGGAAPVAALAGLGESWVFEQVSYKFHACCHGLHAMLEALGTMRNVAPGSVAEVTIRTNPRWLKVCNIETPGTGLEAKFSYRHTAAMALAGWETGALASYSEAACTDPTLAALRTRVAVVSDSTVSDTATDVTVRLNDGTERRAAHDLATPEPLEQRRAKLHAKASALLGAAPAEALADRIESLETMDTPVTLAWLLTGDADCLTH